MGILKDIANYFRDEYDGDDKSAPGMTITPEKMREVTAMHQELCAMKRYKAMAKTMSLWISPEEELPVKDGEYEVLVKDYDSEKEWIATATYRSKVICTGNKIGFGFCADHYDIDFEESVVIGWREKTY